MSAAVLNIVALELCSEKLKEMSEAVNQASTSDKDAKACEWPAASTLVSPGKARTPAQDGRTKTPSPREPRGRPRAMLRK